MNSPIGDSVAKFSRKQIAGAIVSLTAILASGVTIANQAQVAEPLWMATRGFVRSELRSVTRQQRMLELSQLQGRRDQTRDKLFDLRTLVKTMQGAQPELQRNIERQIEELEYRLKDLDRNVEYLQKQINLLSKDQ